MMKNKIINEKAFKQPSVVKAEEHYKITLENAIDVLIEYPNEDDYVQAHFQQGFNGEYWDNTCETSGRWQKCKKIIEVWARSFVEG